MPVECDAANEDAAAAVLAFDRTSCDSALRPCDDVYDEPISVSAALCDAALATLC